MSHNSPQPTAEQYNSIIRIYRQMLSVAGDQQPTVVANIRFSMSAAVFEAFALLCFFPLLHAIFATDKSWVSIGIWLAVMTIFVMLESYCRWQVTRLSHSKAYTELGHQLKMNLAHKLRTLPLETLYQKRTGELTNIISGSTEDVVMMMNTVATMVIRPAIVPLIVVIACFWISWPLAVLMLLLFPLAIPLYLFNRKVVRKDMQAFHEANQVLASDMIEYTQGITVLRATNAINQVDSGFKQNIKKLETIQRDSHVRGLIPNLLLSSLVELGLWLAAVLGVWLITQSWLSIPSFIAVIIITTRFAEPMTLFLSFSMGFEVFERGLASINSVLAIRPLDAKEPNTVPETFAINIDQVTYQYPDADQAALQQLSLSIPAKSMTALVGPSGCGKSTLTRLLMRYGDPQSGSIQIGGIDIRQIEQEQLMQLFSVVFQDVYLFDESIIDNIALAKADATEAEVIEAAKLAHCHEFITQLPNGYQTRVGEIGSKLSGGEKQRISIARAILKDTPIIILDEPTAALDIESEVAVQRAMDTLVKDKTIIVIAHRLSTITHADRIVVLEDGQLVEQGEHEALIQQQGRYHDLWQAQRSAKVWRINDANNAEEDNKNENET